MKRQLLAPVLLILLFVGCTQPVPSQGGGTVSRNESGATSEESISEEPIAERTPLRERLRDHHGVFTGAPLPRLGHWRGNGARSYKSAFALCSRIGMTDLAIQLDVQPSASAIAVAVLSGFRRDTWRAAHQGCADGLKWDKRTPDWDA